MTPQPLGSRYLLEEPLGQGGMGTVWRGRDRQSGVPCAIKILRPELAADPEALTRFVRERTALIRFRHQNVVTMRDMIVEGDLLALVMDLIDGGDLNSYLRSRGGTLPAGEALELTAQVCDALAAAHAAGIVHRDLKPANVLLDAGQVRLADFGIAQIADQTRATNTGMVVGTIGFMAPEVIRGEAPTPACDVYAAGITLYELLTGTRPFTGQVAAVLHGHLESLPGQPAGVPDRLWALMSACLAKDPSARPAAAAVARALRDPALLREQTAYAPVALPREPTGYGQGTVPARSPYSASPWAPGAGSADPTYVRSSGAATGPVHQGLASAMTSTTAAAAASFSAGGQPPDQTAAAVASSGAGGQSPDHGRRAGGPGSRVPQTRALLAAAAAVVLVMGGVAAYLATSGSPAGKTAAQATSLGAATQIPLPTLAGATSHLPTKRPVGSRSAEPATPSSNSSSKSSATPAAGSTAGGSTVGGSPVSTGTKLVTTGAVNFTSSGTTYPTGSSWANPAITMAFTQGVLTLASTSTGAVLASYGSGTYPDAYITLQTDGNLVIYSGAPGNNTALWTSGTGGNPGDTMTLQTNGQLVINSTTGILWAAAGSAQVIQNTAAGNGMAVVVLSNQAQPNLTAKNGSTYASAQILNNTSGYSLNGWLETSTNGGASWTTISATESLNGGTTNTGVATSAYPDGPGHLARACFQFTSWSGAAVHCTSGI